tara:strand:- start:930 stop:1262 length:333 start_codon:yes stop_codon:yes gene_type:complete
LKKKEENKMANFNIHDWRMSQLLKEIDEHHGDETFPGKDMSAFDLLDKLKKGNKELYDQVEAFMSQMEENMTGTGASFTAGNGAAYSTPKAFGKRSDKDIEVLGYKKVKK